MFLCPCGRVPSVAVGQRFHISTSLGGSGPAHLALEINSTAALARLTAGGAVTVRAPPPVSPTHGAAVCGLDGRRGSRVPAAADGAGCRPPPRGGYRASRAKLSNMLPAACQIYVLKWKPERRSPRCTCLRLAPVVSPQRGGGGVGGERDSAASGGKPAQPSCHVGATR